MGVWMYKNDGIFVPVWVAFDVIGEVANDKIVSKMVQSSIDI